MRSALKRVNPTGALSWSESTQAEFAKDIWDARNLPGVHYGLLGPPTKFTTLSSG